MIKFCPKCSNLMRKKLIGGKYFLICKCGYRKEFDPNSENREKIVIKKEKELKNNLIIKTRKDDILIQPKTQKTCPYCGFNEAAFWQEQILSADEPSTTFFRCLKCNKVWREY
ncbi:MAG: transcription factor S [Promethearchaeia archaeon]